MHCKVHADHTKGYALYAVQITVSPSLSFCLSFEVGSHFTISYYQCVHVKVRLKIYYLNITSSYSSDRLLISEKDSSVRILFNSLCPSSVTRNGLPSITASSVSYTLYTLL